MEKESIIKKILTDRKYRLILFLVLTIQLAITLTYILIKTKQDSGFIADESTFLLLTGFLVILTSMMVLYLQGSKSKNENTNERDYNRIDDRMLREVYMMSREQNEKLRYEFRKLNERIESKLGEIGEINSIELTDNDKAKLLEIIENKIEKNVADKVISSFEENYAQSAFLKQNYRELLSDLEQIHHRLYREISKLSLRGNLNLAIGSATTIFAILILYLTVIDKTLNFTTINDSLSFFIPRVSIVVFIEIFSFFFLKLYKTNLSDIKYYQNEITNAEFKILALKSAFAKDDPESIRKVIDEFATVERNFILKKGESTVEIEKNRLENESNNSWKELIKETLKMKK